MFYPFFSYFLFFFIVTECTITFFSSQIFHFQANVSRSRAQQTLGVSLHSSVKALNLFKRNDYTPVSSAVSTRYVYNEIELNSIIIMIFLLWLKNWIIISFNTSIIRFELLYASFLLLSGLVSLFARFNDHNWIPLLVVTLLVRRLLGLSCSTPKTTCYCRTITLSLVLALCNNRLKHPLCNHRNYIMRMETEWNC